MTGRVVVIGVGNEFRRDDAAGPEVVARLRGHVPDGVELFVNDGEPTALIEAWDGAVLAVVVDAVHAHPGGPGRLHRLVLEGDRPAPDGPVSSHGLGLSEAIGLARALGRMPERLVVHAVEADDTAQGTGLTPAVTAAVPRLVAAVLGDLAGAARRR